MLEMGTILLVSPFHFNRLILGFTMKTLLLAIGFAFGGILPTFAQAQVIPLTIDSTQSSVSITIADASSSSQLSGNASLELQSFSSQPDSAQISDLNLVLDEALGFNLFGGFATAFTSPGDVTISMVNPGAASEVTGSTFNQLANSLMLDGDLEIIDAFGFAGGDQTFDLSGVPISPVDFNNVNITRLGNLITVSSSVTIDDTVNFGVSDLPLVIEMNFVASGVAPELTLLGDVNLDGAVDCFDISPFIIMLVTRGFSEEADCDGSGLINYRDIPPFIFHLSGG